MSKEQAIDPLNQALAKLLGVVTDSAGKVVDVASVAGEKAYNFLSTEIPDVIQQLLWWKFAESFIYFLIAVLLIVVWIIAEVKIYTKLKSDDVCDEMWIFGWGVVGCFIRFGVFVQVTILVNLNWLQIWIAPKIYLLEYAAKLIGGK